MMLELLENCLAGIEDVRQEMKVRHPLKELIFLVFCGVLCGCEDYEEIVLYGEEKIDFLREYFPYENGIASVATLSRLFSWLSPDFFKKLLAAFLERYFPNLPKNLISIDGKTARGARDGAKCAPHHLTAFASDSKLVLSHMAVDEETNEIKAIPAMIDALDIEDGLVTVDAAGCQREIAELITGKKGDYLLGLKGNQGTLYENTQTLFPAMTANETDYNTDTYQETEPNGGGRIETRKVTITDNIVRLQFLHDWPGLKSVIKVERTRDVKGKISCESSFYICSKVMSAKEAADAVRGHWGIEALHYVLDVAFSEDKSRVRKDHAPENMNILRKITFNLITRMRDNAASPKDKKRSFQKYRNRRTRSRGSRLNGRPCRRRGKIIKSLQIRQSGR